ncbi:nitroreductase family protein [Brochothrix thermosphacta]|uniref:nitroreductase family protein n=1 Tax=Brochothrix thermosphacta TaxID=2756 RepID=UPI00265D0D03|nr:nitroreductase family protein [Brochothrix thermosphacta]WKK69639.1 nitroreductase family protein [Brochothrix thermosphacta]
MNKDIKLIDAINNRHSVKEFDPNVKISKEEMEEMLSLAIRAPSSINLQPWRFVIVEAEEQKQQLDKLVRFNQTQLHTSSAMILVLGDNNHADKVEEIFSQNVAAGSMTEDIKNYYIQAVTEQIIKAPVEVRRQLAISDANLVAMQIMLVAKAYGYDTNPIGGYERKEVMDVLNIDSERYTPAMFIAIGKSVKEAHGSERLPIKAIASWNTGTNGVVGE